MAENQSNVLSMKQRNALRQQAQQAKIPNVNFSKYQWGLVRRMAKGIITDEEALYIHQGTFNSFCRANREYVVKVRGGYTLSEQGFAALELFNKADVVKSHPSQNLGKWVNLLHTVRQHRNTA